MDSMTTGRLDTAYLIGLARKFFTEFFEASTRKTLSLTWNTFLPNGFSDGFWNLLDLSNCSYAPAFGVFHAPFYRFAGFEFKEDDEFVCKVAKTVQETSQLIENGFEYICASDIQNFSGNSNKAVKLSRESTWFGKRAGDGN